VLVVGMPFHAAAAVSLTTVIATSTAVSAATAGRQLINLRLGMLLEVATAAGGVGGGSPRRCSRPPRCSGCSRGRRRRGLMTLARAHQSNVLLEPDADPGRLGGRLSRRAARARR
jgi:hypothetical protein